MRIEYLKWFELREYIWLMLWCECNCNLWIEWVMNLKVWCGWEWENEGLWEIENLRKDKKLKWDEMDLMRNGRFEMMWLNKELNLMKLLWMIVEVYLCLIGCFVKRNIYLNYDDWIDE